MGLAESNGRPAYSVTAAAWLYLAFVVYGSFVPFVFQDLSLSEAWAHFLHMRYLHLNMGERADWVANLILYIPIGFLIRAMFARGDHFSETQTRPGAALTSISISLIIALAVEFLQVYAPGRTVSLNDVIAEAAGGVIGVAGYRLFGTRVFELLRRTAVGGGSTVRAGVILYTATYLGLSLFPYDFLLGGDELAAKLAATDTYGLLVAGRCASFVPCIAKLTAEVVAAVPLGVLLQFWARRNNRFGLGGALLSGLGLGILIEGAQLLLVSGVSQGASVLTRALGVALGFHLAARLQNASPAVSRRIVRPLLVLVTPCYLTLLVAVNAWFAAPWRGLNSAIVELGRVHWTPFYYHYYTSETAAIVSLMAVALMYAPVGGAFWVWRWAGGATRLTAVRAGAIATVLALLIETGKLFVQARRPDPTDLLIAFGAAWLTFRGFDLVVGGASRQQPVGSAAHQARDWPIRWAPVAAVAVVFVGVSVAWMALAWPIDPAPLLLGLVTYACVLWLRPDWWAVSLPLLLPVVDFAPWSGRVLFNEFDLVLLITWVVAGLRFRPRLTPRPSGVAGGSCCCVS